MLIIGFAVLYILNGNGCSSIRESTHLQKEFPVTGSVECIHSCFGWMYLHSLLWEVQYQAALEEVSLCPRCWMLARDLSKARWKFRGHPSQLATRSVHEWLVPRPHDDLGLWFSPWLHSPAMTLPLTTWGGVTWEKSPPSSSEWSSRAPSVTQTGRSPACSLEEAQILLISVTWQRWDTRGQRVWVCFPAPCLTAVRTSRGEGCSFACCCCFFI